MRLGDSSLSMHTALKIFMYHPIVRPESTWLEDWMLVLLVAVLILLGWAKVNYPKRLSWIVESITKERILKQTMREEYLLSHRASVVYLIVYAIALALAVYLWSNWKGLTPPDVHGSLVLLLLLLGFGIILLIRSLSIHLSRWLLDADFGLEQFHFHSFLNYMFVGIVSLPLVAISLFLKWEISIYLIYAVGVIYAMSYLYRIWWGLREAMKQGVPWHYLMLYLCTLEILPLIAIAALSTSYFS